MCYGLIVFGVSCVCLCLMVLASVCQCLGYYISILISVFCVRLVCVQFLVLFTELSASRKCVFMKFYLVIIFRDRTTPRIYFGVV